MSGRAHAGKRDATPLRELFSFEAVGTGSRVSSDFDIAASIGARVMRSRTGGATVRCEACRLPAAILRTSFGVLRTSFARGLNNRGVQKPNVAIALPDDAERASAVITRGRRFARALGLEWIALRVTRATDTNDGDGDRLAELVAALGGRLVLAEARDVARAIVELSEREHARLLVIGRSRRPRFLRRLRRGTTERILHARRPFDVVIAADGAER